MGSHIKLLPVSDLFWENISEILYIKSFSTKHIIFLTNTSSICLLHPFFLKKKKKKNQTLRKFFSSREIIVAIFNLSLRFFYF